MCDNMPRVLKLQFTIKNSIKKTEMRYGRLNFFQVKLP